MQSGSVRARKYEPRNVPSPRWNVTRLIAYFCMQGGGAYIDDGGSANFINCALYGNTATVSVRARILNLLDASSSAPLNVTRLIAYFRTQGGAAHIYGSSSFTHCNLHNNAARKVRVHSHFEPQVRDTKVSAPP